MLSLLVTSVAPSPILEDLEFNMNNLVSVIIPCYNASSYIDDLSWVFKQTYPDIELVLVDDCSKDDTWQKLQEFKQKFADKRVVVASNEHNMGPGPTRCHGTELSTGQFLCFWDADDYAESNFIEKMLTKLEQEQADWAYCGHFRHYGDNNVKIVTVSPELQAASLKARQLLFKSFSCEPWNKLVRRSFVETNGIYFPEVFCGDDECWSLQLILKAEKIAFIDEPLYHYHVDVSNSVTKRVDERFIHSRFKLIDFEYDYVVSQGFVKQNPDLLKVVEDDIINKFSFIYTKLRNDPVRLHDAACRYYEFCNSHNISLKTIEVPLIAAFRWYRLILPIGKLKEVRNHLKHKFYFYQNKTKDNAVIKLIVKLAKRK